MLAANQPNFDLGNLGNMDKSSIYVDCLLSLIHKLKKGAKWVKIDTHGGKMVRVGLAVCGLGNEKRNP